MTMEIPERIGRRVKRRIGATGYTLPTLTVKLYSIWLDGGIELDDRCFADIESRNGKARIP
jgi:hypothetical protein